MNTPCIGLCPGTISWRPAYLEWHGRCSLCGGFFLLADPECVNRDTAVSFLPTGSKWQKVEVG